MSFKFLHSFLEPSQFGKAEFDYIVRYENGRKCLESKGLRSDEEFYTKLLKEKFNSKESYLDWVQNWKECYRWLSLEIRMSKRMMSDPLEGYERKGTWQSRREIGRDIARRMIKMRHMAKKISYNMKKEQESYELTETCKTNALTERLDITY